MVGPSKQLWASLACGALALAALTLHLERLEARITGGGSARVLALTADLSAGQAITRDVVAAREVPQAFRESRHIAASEFDDVVGAPLAVDVRANDTLQWTDLASIRPKARTLSALIPHGMRAMALNARGGFDALLRPGDRVDVLRAGAGADVVLQDVVVLAVGDDLGGPEARGPKSAARGAAITVSVTLEQSRQLALAEQQGALRLVMRNPDDVALGGGALRGSAEAAR